MSGAAGRMRAEERAADAARDPMTPSHPTRPAERGEAGREIRVGIINDFDAPQANMLALAVGLPGAARLKYLSPHRRYRFRDEPASLSHWTDIDVFGVTISMAPGGRLIVEQTGPSRAIYPDGVPRKWQDRRRVEIDVRLDYLPKLMRFFRRPSPPTDRSAPR